MSSCGLQFQFTLNLFGHTLVRLIALSKLHTDGRPTLATLSLLPTSSFRLEKAKPQRRSHILFDDGTTVGIKCRGNKFSKQ